MKAIPFTRVNSYWFLWHFLRVRNGKKEQKSHLIQPFSLFPSLIYLFLHLTDLLSVSFSFVLIFVNWSIADVQHCVIIACQHSLKKSPNICCSRCLSKNTNLARSSRERVTVDSIFAHEESRWAPCSPVGMYSTCLHSTAHLGYNWTAGTVLQPGGYRLIPVYHNCISLNEDTFGCS